MAVAQETLEHLRTAGLAEIDPEIAELLGRELERQRNQIELIASENFTWPSVLEAVGQRARRTSTRRATPDGATTAAARSSTRSRRSRSTARRRSSAPSTRTCSRTPARRRTWPSTSRRSSPATRSSSMRLDHGGHLTHGLKVNFSGRMYTIVRLRRRPRDGAHRLRRGPRAREGAPAEADHLRRLGLPARDRRGALPRDRRRGRRAAAVRHGALRGPRRGRAAPEPRAALRLRHVDDAQDARGPARRLHPLQGGAREGRRPRGVPGHAGRPARAHDRREGRVLPDRRDRGVPRVPDAGARERRLARRHAARGWARPADRRHRHASAPDRSPQRRTGRARTRRSGCTTSSSPSTATRCRSTSVRRRSARASASERRRRRCAASTRTTSARSARSWSTRSERRPTSTRSAAASTRSARSDRSTRGSAAATTYVA